MPTRPIPRIARRLTAYVLCLAVALACAFAAVKAFKALTFDRHRDNLLGRTKVLHDGLASITIDSRVMGATILLGLIQPTIKLAVSGATLTESDLSEIHDLLDPLRRQFEASGTYLINAKGIILIHDTDGKSSAGLNVHFRPYFTQAMAGQANVYAAVGNNTDKRGLYYAAPVHAGALRSTPVIGVVLTKLPGSIIDTLLAKSGCEAVLLSPQGVVYASTRPEWLYAMTPPVTPQRLKAIRNLRRFGQTFDKDDPRVLPFVPTAATADLGKAEYGIATASLDWSDPDGPWTLVTLQNTATWFPAGQQITVGAVSGIAAMLLGLFVLFYNDYRQKRDKRAARFRTLGVALEVSPLAVIITDAANHIQWVNPRFEQVTGYTLDEVRDRDPKLLASGKTPQEMYQEMWRALRSGQPWMGEFINQGKDATTYHARVSISPVSDRAGRLLGYVGLQEDITEHKRLLSRLQSQLWLNEGLTTFAGALQNQLAPDTLSELALAELVRFLSLPYGAVHGRTDDETSTVLARFGGQWGDEEPPRDQALVNDVMRSGRPLTLRDLPDNASVALAGGVAGLHQIRLLPLGDNHTSVGVLEIGLLRDLNEEEEHFLDKARAELAMALKLALDISQRLKVQKALADQLAFQQVLLDTIPNPVFYKGADTRFLGFNRAYEETFAIHRDALVGKRVLELEYLPEADRTAYQQEDEHLIASGGSTRKEMLIPFSDGRTHETLYYVAAFRKADGTPGGLVGTFVDISDQKDVERALAAAKEAAVEATLLKSDFLANMSHEIRTPMNAIIGMAHLALKTELTPRQRDYMHKIRQSSQHLLGIINDILDFSKIEAGKLTVEKTDFDLSSVLENVATLIREKAEAKGLELIFDVAADVPQDLVGDPLRLGQILINYANNAVKFTDTGEIDIRVRLAEETDDEVLLRFEVRDTGIGLSEHQISRLFQSFSQADTSTTRKYGGTGLGLAISMRLAELMHGEVGVQSTPGQGSTFWFTARLGKSSRQLRILVPDPDLRGRRILVVDDNENARAVLADMLASMRFKVDTAASGLAAIEAVRSKAADNKPYEVVFLDWQMPGMDGMEAAHRIRALELAPPPHLLMVTAFGREEVLSGATGAGFEHVLIKPVTPSLLFDTIIRTLGAANGDEQPTVAGDNDATQTRASTQGARLLLVEDNEINRQVAYELLTDAGFVVESAENGEIALEMLDRAAYDAVLMDMQMPVMDGLAATIAIRKNPALKGLPVIAMTANAMQQDRDRCKAVGMDGFIAKPIDPQELFDTLNAWIKPGRRSAEAAPSAIPQPSSPDAPPCELTLPKSIPGIDMVAGLARLSGKKRLYRSLLIKMRRDFPEMHRALRQALEAGQDKEAEIAAHSVKGSAGNVGATVLQDAAATLESALRHQDRDAIAPALTAFEETLTAFITALKVLGDETSTACDTADAAHAASPQQVLRQTMETLATALATRKPKPSRQALAAVKALVWPPALQAALANLEARLGKYDFTSAQATALQILESLGPPSLSGVVAPPEETAPADGSTEALSEEMTRAFEALAALLAKRRPKPCAEALAAVRALPADAALQQRIGQIATLLGGYKFAKAQEIVETLLQRGAQ